MSYEITLTNAIDNEPFKFDTRLVAQLQEYELFSAEKAEGKTDEEIDLLEPDKLATLVTFHCGCQFMADEDIDVIDAMIEKAGKVVS